MAELGPNVILSWVGELTDLEQQIEDLQGAKRDLYAGIREQHGKPTADGLKAAMRIHRMDSEKRAAAEQVDEETFRILAIIEKGASRAPRATREEKSREIPTHEPETRDVDEQVAPVQHQADTPAKPSAELTAALEHFTPPAFLSGEPKVLRPNCLRPDRCAGYGSNHCHECRKAADKTEAA